MIRLNTEFMGGMAIGLSIVAFLAVIIAIIVGYRKNGEINYVLIALAAVMLSSNLVIVKSRRNKSLKRNRTE